MVLRERSSSRGRRDQFINFDGDNLLDAGVDHAPRRIADLAERADVRLQAMGGGGAGDAPAAEPSLQERATAALAGPLEALAGPLNAASHALDAGLDAASAAVRRGAAAAAGQAGAARRCYETGVAHSAAGLEMADEALIGALRRGVAAAREHEAAATAGAAAAALLLLPPTRRLLWRATLGRLRSPEAARAATEERAAALAAAVAEQGAEAAAAAARLAAAREAYAGARSALRAAAADLRGLDARMRRTDRGAAALMRDLRELRHAQALQLRADAAGKAAEAARQRGALGKLLRGVEKDGL